MLGALLVVWPFGRHARRAVAVRRGTRVQQLCTSLGLLRTELLDWGIVAPPSLTLDELALLLRERLAVDAEAALGRAQAVLFGGVEASPGDVAAVTAVRRAARRAARARRGRLRACLALYGVRTGARA